MKLWLSPFEAGEEHEGSMWGQDFISQMPQ